MAFGLGEGSAPSQFAVALALLRLLSEAASQGPVACVVDDAQWLDRASAQVLAFAARRIDAEPIAIVFGLWDPHGVDELDGLPELALSGLSDQAARDLLASAQVGLQVCVPGF